MARLPELLEQLEAAVTAAGGTVHWARDADEANRIVAELVRATGAERGRQGQVDGHPGDRPQRGARGRRASPPTRPTSPSSSSSSGTTSPRTSSCRRSTATAPRSGRSSCARWPGGRPADRGPDRRPAALAEAARRHLREKFLRAKVAISGANFAVAETGTLSVVESEGNGRMCLTLPETLITVMGIEKLVPTWHDLEVFLQLLPRSSTGERMNPYTSMWTGVTAGRRAAGVPPGPARQRPHRGARRRGRPRGAALHPLLRLPQRLPGLRAHRRARLRLGLPGPDRRDPVAAAHRACEDNASLPYASSLCGACFDVCPVKIDIPSMLVDLRHRHVEEQRPRLAGADAGGGPRWPRRPG